MSSGEAFNASQFLVGCIFGGVGGYMDTVYIEPFGVIMGSALAVLQILDQYDIAPMPWNTQVKKKGDSDAATEVAGFFKNNTSAMMGFASGYVVGYNFVDWTSDLSLDPLDDLAERTEETVSKQPNPALA